MTSDDANDVTAETAGMQSKSIRGGSTAERSTPPGSDTQNAYTVTRRHRLTHGSGSHPRLVSNPRNRRRPIGAGGRDPTTTTAAGP